jgi:hypothetical protein
MTLLTRNLHWPMRTGIGRRRVRLLTGRGSRDRLEQQQRLDQDVADQCFSPRAFNSKQRSLAPSRSVQRRATFQFVSSMAGNALPGRGFVKKHCSSCDGSGGFVATLAMHVAMGTLQGKRRLLFVIEQRRFPFRAVVTTATLCNSGVRELRPVNVRMAGLASRSCCFEIRAAGSDLRI